MDKETGKALLVNDKEVTAETKFVPEKADGTVVVTFTFDATGLEGKTLVAFETCTYEGKNVAVHADINDEKQTIYVPEFIQPQRIRQMAISSSPPKELLP